MGTKHTPGPWHVHSGKLRPNFPTEIFAIHSEDGQEVVGWTGFDGTAFPEDREANARLAAAAPELLEACREGIRMCDFFGHSLRKMRPVFEAAIAKATGDTP
jgi:hypothetical protein